MGQASNSDLLFCSTNKLRIHPFTLNKNDKKMNIGTPWNIAVVNYFWNNGHINMNVIHHYLINIMTGMMHSDGFRVSKLRSHDP